MPLHHLGCESFRCLATSGQPSNAWGGLQGYLTKDMLTKYVPHYKHRRYYLSGPSALVDNYRHLLRGLGVDHRAIITDHFSGY